MKLSMQKKLDLLVDRYEEVNALLSAPEIINNQQQFRELSKEYAHLQPLVELYKSYEQAVDDQANAQQLLQDSDIEIRELAQEELKNARDNIDHLSQALQIALLPHDPNDQRNIFLEIRAGAGGNEAAIFAGDLFRMYSRYAENQGWQVEIISMNESEQGGFKEIIARISGQDVYSHLKFESGAHRVQRVPVTESQGRIHTSTCTVAVMPEIEEIDDITINPNDLRIDTYRASGAGGQHVNKTDSAIRITHLPTGIVVECQDERSQHKNRAKALALLHAKILSQEQAKQEREQAQTRRDLVGTGDRSERIRTYNFPQTRMTDHRINLTLYRLPEIMEGDLAELIAALRSEYQADQLAALSPDDE